MIFLRRNILFIEKKLFLQGQNSIHMLISIVFALVILSIYKIVFELFDVNSKKIISNAVDVKKANDLRKKLFLRRKKVFIYFFSTVLLILIITSILFFERLALNNLIVLIVLFVMIKFDKPKTELYGNISYQTPEDFVANNKEYYLYLRGFNADIPFGEENKGSDQSFNESMFVEVVDYALGVTCCALGMTKEVDSPIGATRVYVDDDNWQKNVLELMKNANRIFILVNDRKSCVWEIEQSIALLSKTVFIVDDFDKYNTIRNRFISDINMPAISDSTSLPFFFESGMEAVSFDNTWKGYFNILGLDADAVEEKKVEERKAQMLEHPLKC